MKRIVVLGEALGLVATTGIGTLDLAREAVIGIGGAETNVAVGAARLGVPVSWIGRVGDDAVGRLILKRLTGDAIDVHAVLDPSYTALMVRHRRTAAVTHVDYHRKDSAGSHLVPVDVPDSVFADCGVVHTTGITLALGRSATAAAERAIDLARANGATVSFDVNYRSKLWPPNRARPTIIAVLDRVDVLFAGIQEAQLLLDSDASDALELARGLAEFGATEVIVKRGPRGCAAWAEGRALERPSPPVPVIDTVGAGDAFVAGYLAEMLAGGDIERRLDLAVAAGAYAVSVPGDCELSPTREELEEMQRATDTLR